VSVVVGAPILAKPARGYQPVARRVTDEPFSSWPALALRLQLQASMKRDGAGVEVLGTKGDPALHRRVLAQMQRHLGRIGLTPASGRAAFTDENGPKGGRAMRCALTVTLPYRPGIHVEQVDTDPRRAFDGAMEVLERELARYRERDRDGKRHPQKYFAANQAEAVERPRPTRRKRRAP
jgi:ribosome-associated translation inhibitor RaiA